MVSVAKEMELEFDKEIDSLLRKADRGTLVGSTPGDKPQVHLDADQLAAFAENAIPEKSRGLYMSHLADCDRCRRILSGLVSLNAEYDPAEERVVAPAISLDSVEPWYRRLLLPNLAYVMGGLVLVFGGLIAFTVLQSSDNEVSMSSQSAANVAPAARGPMFEDAQAVTEQMANTNATSSAASAPAAQAANASANAANVAGNPAKVGADERRDAAPADESKLSLDGDAAKPVAAAPAAAPPAPMATPAPRNETADTVAAAEAKDDNAKARSLTVKKAEDLEQDAKAKGMARTQAGGVAKSTPGPSREAQQNFPNRANNTFEMFEEKRVSGKGFQRRNNVWYDNSYRGQATTNVRRGSEDYRKLDSGLRTIAESLSGVVVVVWEGKAYRIQ